jgi:hypothetical protein
MYVPNIGTCKYIKQILVDLKGEIDSNTINVSNFNIPLSRLDRSFRLKINKQPVDLNSTVVQMDLIDLYKTFHQTVIEYTLNQ